MTIVHMPHAGAEPSPWVARFAPLIAPGGRVLDLACGAGRHVRYLSARGHKVLALDQNVEALENLKDLPGVEILVADLEDGSPWPLGARRFEAIVVTNYLHRPLFPHLLDALEDGGLLIYETFARGNERFGRPRNPDHLLKEDELLELVRGRGRVIAFEHIELPEPRPAVLQRICARKAPASADQ